MHRDPLRYDAFGVARSHMSTKESIHVTIPPRLYQVPGAALLAGTLIGSVRGSRQESLRFLAENVHRAPRTVKGWYFYNKTKNYRIMLAGLREGGRDAGKLGVTALGWVTIEEGMKRMGMTEAAEIAAGVGTGGIFGAVYGLGLHGTGRGTVLGLLVGIGLYGLRKSREKLATMAAEIPSGTSEEGVER